jgi:plastocyanin
MRGRGGLVTAALVGVLTLAAAGCGGGDEGGGGSASATTAAPATTGAPETTAAGGGGENEFKLTASDFAWNPDSLQMSAGTQAKVEVTNEDQATHSFTFQDAGVDQVVAAGENATASFTAPAAGDHQFRCKFHPAMTGTVTVT